MYKLAQLFSVSMYFLWFYDYFLTLGDEVRYPHIFRRKCRALTVAQINYAWSGRRSWGEFLPPFRISNISHSHPAVFALFIVVRHSEQDLKL